MGQLIETLMEAASPALVRQIATLLGDTPDATGAALGATLPAMLAALATRADHDGIEEIMHLLPLVLSGANPLDQLADATADPTLRADLMGHGATMATQLLGPQQAPIAAAISQASGARADTVANLLKLAGPMAIGALARQLGGEPTAQGITDLLAAERPAIFARLPAGLQSLITPLAAEPSPLHGTPVEGAAAAALTAGRWVPWLVAAMAAIAVLAGLRSCQAEKGRTSASAAATTPMITEVSNPTQDMVLPDGTVLVLRPGSASFELLQYLNGTDPAPRAFRFDELGYDAATDQLDAASEDSVRSVAAILKAYPALKVRILGHTGGEGPADANLALSTQRAKAVEDLIEATGIADDRVESEGLGDAEPIATTETAEGRAQNSRTIILVTAR